MRENPFTTFDPKECGILADAIEKGIENNPDVREISYAFLYKEAGVEKISGACAIGYGLLSCFDIEILSSSFEILDGIYLANKLQIPKMLCLTASSEHFDKRMTAKEIIQALRAV